MKEKDKREDNTRTRKEANWKKEEEEEEEEEKKQNNETYVATSNLVLKMLASLAP